MASDLQETDGRLRPAHLVTSVLARLFSSREKYGPDVIRFGSEPEVAFSYWREGVHDGVGDGLLQLAVPVELDICRAPARCRT